MNQVRIPSTWLSTGLVLATVWIFSPFWPSLLLALWLGLAGLQVMPRLTGWLRGRSGLAATLLMVAVVMVAIPIVALLFSVATDAWLFVQRLAETPEIREILANICPLNTFDAADEQIWEVHGERRFRQKRIHNNRYSQNDPKKTKRNKEK